MAKAQKQTPPLRHPSAELVLKLDLANKLLHPVTMDCQVGIKPSMQVGQHFNANTTNTSLACKGLQCFLSALIRLQYA